MTDPLPPDVREYLQRMARRAGNPGATALLRKYPKPPPPPTPNTKEQNIAFRKAWDEHVEEKRSRGQPAKTTP